MASMELLDCYVHIVGVNKGLEAQKQKIEKVLAPILGKTQLSFSTMHLPDQTEKVQGLKAQVRLKNSQILNLNKEVKKLEQEKQQQKEEIQQQKAEIKSHHRTPEKKKKPAAVIPKRGRGINKKKQMNYTQKTPSPQKEPDPETERRRTRIMSETQADILEDVGKMETGLHNPFGEALTDVDIKYAFDQVDENGDGRITLKEFVKAMQNLAVDVSPEGIRNFFMDIDTDHNKILTYEEFHAGLGRVSCSQYDIWNKMLGADWGPLTNDDSDIETIARVLSSIRSDWSDRIEAMHAFAKHAIQKMNRKQFDQLMRPVKENLIMQLGDRRSAIVRECCIVIAKIALNQSKFMTRWAPRFLEALFETLRINVEIIAISAHQAAKALVRCVPETSRKLEITTELQKATKENWIVVRRRGFEYLHILISHSRVHGQKKCAAFWSKCTACLAKGFSDPALEVREACIAATCELYVLNSVRTEETILANLRHVQKTRFKSSLAAFKTKHDIE